jgi:nitrate reductase gamma subunit
MSFFITLCQILGPVFVLAAISMAIHLEKCKKVMNDLQFNHWFVFMVNTIRCIIWLMLFTVIDTMTSPVDMALKIAGAVIALIGAICILFPAIEQKILKTSICASYFLIAMLGIQWLIGIAMMYVGYGA